MEVQIGKLLFLLLLFFGPTIVGLYSYAITLLLIPMTVFGEAIGQILFQQAAEKRAAGEDLSALVWGVFKRLVPMAVLPSFLLIVISPELFGVALGQRWSESGVYVALLAPLLLTQFLASPLTVLTIVFERQGTALAINCLGFVLRCGVLLLGGYFIKDPRITIFLFGLASAFMYASHSAFSLYLGNVSYLKALRHLALNALCCAPCVLLISLAKWYFYVGEFGILFMAALGSSIYFSFILYRDHELRSILLRKR